MEANMRKQWFVMMMTIALILCTAALVQATDNSLGIANKQTIVFGSPTVVGGTLLPAGQYQVLHQMNGTEHIMEFKGIAGTKGEAKAKCNLVPLGEKATKTEQRYTENAKNEHVLQEMTFRGDSAKHVLEP
jgi:hypothetical protein